MIASPAFEAVFRTFHDSASSAVAAENNDRVAVMPACGTDSSLTRRKGSDVPTLIIGSGATCRTDDCVSWKSSAGVEASDSFAVDEDWKERPIDALNSRRYDG